MKPMSKLKVFARWVGRIALGILLLLIAGGLFVYIRTNHRINKKYTFSEPDLIIPTDSGSIARGRHLYQIRSCADCHGAKLQGGVFINDALLLRLTAPNLTKGKRGIGNDLLSEDWVRILRHGVDKNGQSLWIMPSHESTVLSKEDLASLIAYCQNAAPVDSEIEKLKEIGPIGRVLMMLDRVAILPAERINHATPMAVGTPTDEIARGKYLAATCQGCHMPDMKGGGPLAPGHPSVPDISSTGAPGKWDAAQFIATLRHGRTPEGKLLRNEFMPWQNMKHLTDDELKAILSYLTSVK
jgi:mono/diheme cytochrome c family protein